MLVRVFFNDAAGRSFAPGVNAGSDARAELAASLDWQRQYRPMADGYRAEQAVMVESELSPLVFHGEDDPPNAAERAWVVANGDFRSNGRRERSLSVGDAVLIDGQWYAVANVGFEPVEAPAVVEEREVAR
jgi:hypothetical protein